MIEEKDGVIGKASEKKMKCEICGKEFGNYKSLSAHFRTHKITSKEYYDKFFKKEGEGICPVCGKETNFKNIRDGYHKFCSNKCARSGKNNPMFGKRGEENPFYGKHHSEEAKKKISETSKGKHLSEESRKKISNVRKGKHHSEETKKKISDANKGKHLSEETKKKMSDAHKGKLKGENNPNYKDGISLKKFKDAFGMEPEEWKKLAQEIRKRDNFTCQYCGKKNAADVHHIIPRRVKIDNNPDNLITLCRSCHTKIEHLTNIYLAEGKDPREIFYEKWRTLK
jgi:hypothetical protein